MGNFDETKYPEVSVNFEGSLRNRTEYNNFVTKWIELYDKKQDFLLIFLIQRNAEMLIYHTQFAWLILLKN